MTESSKFKILYIAGASRSGSTILEHDLGRFENVLNIGELRRFHDFYTESETIRDPRNFKMCTCGKKISECEFWNGVSATSGVDLESLNLKSSMRRFSRFAFKILFFFLGARFLKMVIEITGLFKEELSISRKVFNIYSTVQQITNCRYIVDSSKNIHHFLILKTFKPDDIDMVYIQRDGRAVSYSMVNGDRKKIFLGGKYSNSDSKIFLLSKAAKEWFKISLINLIFYWRQKKKEKFFIRYEDFCTNTDEVRTELSKKYYLGTLLSGKERNGTHSIGGSPSRFKKEFKEIRLNENWKRDWCIENYKSFPTLPKLMNRILGYRKH